ncbi:MAG: MBOAT family protein, partial [Bdellovibrionales bacterium]|nr:MBOAT family protein [Bdellovibrionales bacterium]
MTSTLTDFLCAQWIKNSSSRSTKRLSLGISLFSNLSLLIIFKYFYINISAWGLQALINDSSPLKFSVALTFPIGISFYTFQTLSYTIDCYRGKIQPTRNFINFATYVSYFPQLLAGPIERASSLLTQIEAPNRDDKVDYKYGFYIILLGLVKKNFYSSFFLYELNEMQNQENTILSLFCRGVFMIMYVYTDFSGYCDIGRGLSHLFGIKLSLNFKPFYYAKNPTQ